MDSDPSTAFQRVLAAHARRSSERFLSVRVISVAGWAVLCLGFGVYGGRPDLEANLFPVLGYLVVALLLWVAARVSPLVHRRSAFALALLDLPAIFAIQYQGVPLSPSPQGTAGFSVGILAVVVSVSVLTMRARNVLFLGAVAAVLQAVLMVRGGIDSGGVAAAFVALGTLATFGAYTTRQIWLLMQGVSEEELKVAAASRERATMQSKLEEQAVLAKVNADLTRTLEALRAAQAELVRSERMASVATLVKGIAHELNNPVGYIAGNMEPLRRYCDFLVRVATELADGRPRSAEDLARLTRLSERKDLAYVATDLARLTADVAEGARRAKLIIGDLQGLTATSQRSVEEVDLARAVRQTLSLLEPRKGPQVQVEAQLGDLPPVTARAGQLEQVLVNLVDNALRAVGERGTVRVTASAAGERVRLEVSDDGPGMTDEVRQHALEPFFTTRAPGEGSGLGLAIVATVVKDHQGTLKLDSAPGRGTRVTIELPARQELRQPPS